MPRKPRNEPAVFNLRDYARNILRVDYHNSHKPPTSGKTRQHKTMPQQPHELPKVVWWCGRCGEAEKQSTSKKLHLPPTGKIMLIRVRKAETKRDSWVKPDALEYCLGCWVDWMRGDADRDLRAKTSRGLEGDGDGRGVDLYEAQRANDNRVAEATDAMIDSLSRVYIWAIYKTCSVGTPWDFPRADLVSVATDARRELAGKLKNNVCAAVLF